MKIHHKLIDILLNLILWVIILLTVVPLLGLLLIWKFSLIFIAKLFFTNIHPTDPNDTVFALDDTKNIPIVNAAQIWRIKGRVDIHKFRKHFSTCFLYDEDSRRRYRNFYCYLIKFGGFVFKKSVDKLELDKHILERYLEPGMDLNEYIAHWFLKEKFRDNTPLWEMILLHMPLTCNTEEYETIFLYKNHHCLIDGYGFIHIVDKLTGNNSPYLVKDDSDTFLQKLKDAFMLPKILMTLVWDVAATKDLFYPIKNTDKRWYISFSTLDLQAVKQIRRESKTHFITVMTSLMIGALRRLLMETISEDKIPHKIYTANSLPWPDHPRDTLVNHWTGGVFSIPFQTKDPLHRLQGADAFFTHFHETRLHKMVKRLIIPATWCIPSFLMRWGHSADLYYFRYSNTFASLMLSNEPHSLLGNKIENIYLPLGLVDNVPTSVLFGVSTSHSNKLDLSVVANSEIIQDQEAIDRLTNIYFPMELEELRKRLKESNNNDFVVLLNS